MHESSYTVTHDFLESELISDHKTAKINTDRAVKGLIFCTVCYPASLFSVKRKTNWIFEAIKDREISICSLVLSRVLTDTCDFKESYKKGL